MLLIARGTALFSNVAGRFAKLEIQFNSDNAVNGNDDLSAQARERISERLSERFGSRLTRIEVHVRDIDGTSNGPEGIEATIEARPSNGSPIVVTARNSSPMEAVNSALGTMVTRLDAVFGKADRHRK